MLAKLKQNAAALDMQAKFSHLLVLLPKSDQLPKSLPEAAILQAVLERKKMKPSGLAKSPLACNLPSGENCCFAMLDFADSSFEQQSQVRAALALLLAENPKQLCIAVLGSESERRNLAELAVYAAWVNGAKLPVRKKKSELKPLEKIMLHGFEAQDGFSLLAAQACGNILCRELTALPPNELTPQVYRERIRKLVQSQGWEIDEYDFARLKKMGAGAFCAVAQGSGDPDAAIVHLKYRPRGAAKKIALVGKGICFDTGGHNLKPAKYMQGMHEDMNGSAVALGLLLAATQARVGTDIDCWLAIAQNHISPKAYQQNDIVTALDGTTIEIVHTDAEGRMILADALTLASREQPGLIVDFSTLTGSMVTALGRRYSGVLGNREALLELAVACGKASGERLCAFPSDADYEKALKSEYADIKQCSMENEADHILAARFLGKFVGDIPWLHLDLSASNNQGGLGAVGTDITGFGVGWGMAFIDRWLVGK